ncbi:hypothetical protein E2C01_064687 [Portunus trituberculatus]|uniref:Uncharacterized protein n=1 Tax=Portunus trituberculatus TaxID=210409 RepID=A0A5B7HP19_PORTR|nr:hypothetical protein [Portunus trituberculatus]
MALEDAVAVKPRTGPQLEDKHSQCMCSTSPLEAQGVYKDQACLPTITLHTSPAVAVSGACPHPIPHAASNSEEPHQDAGFSHAPYHAAQHPTLSSSHQLQDKGHPEPLLLLCHPDVEPCADQSRQTTHIRPVATEHHRSRPAVKLQALSPGLYDPDPEPSATHAREPAHT